MGDVTYNRGNVPYAYLIVIIKEKNGIGNLP